MRAAKTGDVMYAFIPRAWVMAELCRMMTRRGVMADYDKERMPVPGTAYSYDNQQEQAADDPRASTSTGHQGLQRLTLDTVDDAFRYRPWDGVQRDHGEQVRDALVSAAKVILRTVPDTPLRTRALNCLIDSRMLANAAISFRGRF